MFEIKVMRYNLRNESIGILPKCNFIKYVRYSILYDGAALWNALDKKIVNAQSVADFKTMIQEIATPSSSLFDLTLKYTL